MNSRFETIMYRMIFQIIPTILMVCFLIWNANQHLSLLENQFLVQTLYCAIGIVLGTVVFHFNWRFLPITIIIIAGLSLGNLFINNMNIGDVDYFKLNHQFQLFSILFIIGWCMAYSLIRIRIGPFLLSILFLLLAVILLVRDTELFNNQFKDWNKWLRFFVPTIIYIFYIIFISEQLSNRILKREKVSFGSFSVKTLLVGLLFLVLAITTIVFQKDHIAHQLKQYQEGTDGKSSSMMKESKDGFELNDKNSLSSNNKKKNQLLFAAYIDNFFPGTEYPNPLYLTSFYYSRFDSASETFIKVDDMPDKDLFEPNPSQIPLYSSKVDSSVLAFGSDDKYQKTVEIEVYNKAMTNAEFCAPSTSYYIQPIAVAPEYRQEYKSAYRAKSRVSEWNSAYFIYNSEHPEAIAWQELRYNQLKKVKDFSAMRQDVYEYYTHLPAVQSIDTIKSFARNLVKDKMLPAEKLMAIRDFFLAKDANGKKIFTYSDNPGIPDLPSASKLTYFLFQNKKGYCAYYAAATLFMLRAMGIPSRVTVGFLTEDRSQQNKGWYYYYADQSHAWVQVYFPGYGWLDFDTTVGNDDARQSDQPDGTPPLQPSKATLIINGVITSLDKKSKKITVQTTQYGIADNPTDSVSLSVIIDASSANITMDTTKLIIDSLHVNDTITALDYDEMWTKDKDKYSELSALNKAYQEGIPVAQIIKKKVVALKNIKDVNDNEKNVSHFNKWIIVFVLVGVLLVLILLFPYLLYQYYKRKSNEDDVNISSHYAHKMVQYYDYMMTGKRDFETTSQFASIIDKDYGTHYHKFVNDYLKIKYHPQAYDIARYKLVSSIPTQTINAISSSNKKMSKFLKWMNIFRAINYLINNRKYESS